MACKHLLYVAPDCDVDHIDNTPESIEAAVGGTPDFHRINAHMGVFVNNQGLTLGLQFNAPASMVAGRAIWGPAVVARGDTDDDDKPQPPSDMTQSVVAVATKAWKDVLESAALAGQNLAINADPDAIPTADVSEAVPADWLPGDPPAD